MTPRQSRRTLVLALSLPMLAGCSAGRVSLDDLRPPTPPTPPAPPNPDEPVVRSLVTRIRRLAATAPEPWRSLHAAQLRALGDHRQIRATPTDRTAPIAAEKQLRGELLRACARAHSPELARLTASMAAGIDQLLRSAS